MSPAACRNGHWVLQSTVGYVICETQAITTLQTTVWWQLFPCVPCSCCCSSGACTKHTIYLPCYIDTFGAPPQSSRVANGCLRWSSGFQASPSGQGRHSQQGQAIANHACISDGSGRHGLVEGGPSSLWLGLCAPPPRATHLQTLLSRPMMLAATRQCGPAAAAAVLAAATAGGGGGSAVGGAAGGQGARRAAAGGRP